MGKSLVAYTTLRANGQLKNNVGEKETAKTCEYKSEYKLQSSKQASLDIKGVLWYLGCDHVYTTGNSQLTQHSV